MSSSKDAIHGSLVVLEAVEAARNTRAFMLFLGGVILALIVAGLLSAIGGTLASNDQHLMGALFIFFGVVAAFIIAGTGLSAAGKTLMDQIQQRAQLSVREALMVGLLTLPKLIGIWLIEVAVFVVFVIALAVVLFICKIPLLGPLLYTVVYPVASVLAGILWFTFAFIVNPLAAPALWEGYGVRQALKALGLNRDALNLGRLLPPIVQQLVLLLVVGVVGFIASAILFCGGSFVAALASGIIGFGGNMFSMYAGLGAMATGGANGYIIAMIIGVGILVALAYTFPLMVYLAGTCHIFLNLASSDSAPCAPALAGSPFGPAPFAPEPYTPDAPATVAPAAASYVPVVPAAVPPPLAHTCRHCGAPAEPTDAFCGECGRDLPRGV